MRLILLKFGIQAIIIWVQGVGFFFGKGGGTVGARVGHNREWKYDDRKWGRPSNVI